MRTGFMTFFNACSPMSSTMKSSGTLATASALTRMLPSRASSRTRAAMFTTEPLAP